MNKPRPPRHRPTALPSSPRETRRPPLRAEPEIEAQEDHDKLLRIAGVPAVEALFRRDADRVVRLFYEDRMVPRVGDWCARMAQARRPYRKVEADELARIAGTPHHGGVVAVAEPRPLPALHGDEVEQWARERQPLFILDGIGNSHNLGAIARSLAFFGLRYLLLSDHPAQSGLTDSAHRVAEGGLEFLTVRRVAHLPEVLKQLRPHYRVVGTSLSRGVPVDDLKPDTRPTAIVLGNEEDGLSRATLAACETVISLPGTGSVQSLNVSATAAILGYILRPGKPRAGSKPPRPRRDQPPRQRRAAKPEAK